MTVPRAGRPRPRCPKRGESPVRVGIGGLHHETNSFAPQPATFERFLEADAWPPLLVGGDLFDGVAGANLAVRGMVEAARAAGFEPVPLVWANACPSGPVTREAYERLWALFARELERAGPLDALLLDLHGAMVCEHLEDGEGELLARLRRRLGEIPIVCALDLHANVSPEMVERADALTAYRTYPHVDLAETGERAVALLRTRAQRGPFARFFEKPDYVVPLPFQTTWCEPAKSLYAELARIERAHGVSCSLAMGFPASDTTWMGPAVLAYGHDPERVRAAGTEIARMYAAAEPRFSGRLWSPAEAVREALARPRGPVILADVQDNPGAGGTSDTTGLLLALLEARAPDAALGFLCDPQAAAAAHAAGEGAVLRALPLGGRHGPEGVMPAVADWRVLRLAAGPVEALGPMYRGNRIDLGPTALLAAEHAPGVRVVVTSRRMQAADRAPFLRLGVVPESVHVLALKSTVHFRADFGPSATDILLVEAPGYMPVDPSRLPFRRVRRGLRLRPRTA